MEPDARTCAECNRERDRELERQVHEHAVEVARLEERDRAKAEALQLATENFRLSQSQTWLKTVAVVGWVLVGIGLVISALTYLSR